jgi:hypothetical protein
MSTLHTRYLGQVGAVKLLDGSLLLLLGLDDTSLGENVLNVANVLADSVDLCCLKGIGAEEAVPGESNIHQKLFKH